MKQKDVIPSMGKAIERLKAQNKSLLEAAKIIALRIKNDSRPSVFEFKAFDKAIEDADGL